MAAEEVALAGGAPGGATSIKATYYVVKGPYGAVSVLDEFTLTKPRGG